MNRVSKRQKLRALFLPLLCFACCRIVQAQTPSADELLVSALAARSEIVAYQCTMELVIKEKGQQNGRDKVTRKKIVYELSELDEAFTCIITDIENGRQTTEFRGASTDSLFGGTAKGEAWLIDESRPEEIRVQNRPRVPDPLASGVGFCRGFLNHTSFEKQVRSLRYLVSVVEVETTLQADGKVLMKEIGPTASQEIVWDMKRGYWPIDSKLDFATWEVELDKFEDRWMPSRVYLNCTSPELEASGTYSWKNINLSFPTGKERFREICDAYSCTIR